RKYAESVPCNFVIREWCNVYGARPSGLSIPDRCAMIIQDHCVRVATSSKIQIPGQIPTRGCCSMIGDGQLWEVTGQTAYPVLDGWSCRVVRIRRADDDRFILRKA